MPERKLCLGLNPQFEENLNNQIYMIKEAGYNEIFLPFDGKDELASLIKTANEASIPVQSVHAPFHGCRALWEDDEDAANKALNEITDCIHSCEENYVPIAVSHAFIGFDIPPISKERGLERYFTLIKEAEKCGVKIAFENTEGEEYLEAIFNNFGGNKAVGFCWDSGHEMCYNHSRDMLAKYGKFLLCTHINDNLGIKDINGKTIWLDDLHLLPFDGIGNWEYNASRLIKENYSGTLTFELNKRSKPGRHENDIYDAMQNDMYFAESYKRACRFERLLTEKKVAN